jgi:hypothetical protein
LPAANSILNATEGGHMADIICTVPDCDAQAVLVLNGRPVCRPHCEELASQAVILDGSFRDVLKGPTDEPWPMIAGPFPSSLAVEKDAGTPSLSNGPDPA